MITRGCIWVERDVIDERKITAIYDRQIWSGRSFTGTDYRVDGSVTCIHIFICIFPGKYFILAWPRIVNLFLFQNTLTECVKALRREPEIFKCEIPGSGKENNLKNAGHSAVLTVSLNVRSVSRQSGCRREEERSALPVQNVKQNLLKKADKGERPCVWLYQYQSKRADGRRQKAYQAYYCGLCRQLKSNCGTKGQMLLAYDMTFLIVLLTGLYELPNEKTKFTCALHPTQKRIAWINDATKYAADMNLILAYHNLIDDWNDDRSYTKKAFAKMLDKDYTRIMSKYPRQVGAIEEYMKKTGDVEKHQETNLDLVAGLTGEMVAEVFCWKEDEWAEELRTMGFYMGKFIYLMDAYEDYDRDKKKNCYNPLTFVQEEQAQDLDTWCRLLLTSMMSECAKSFERLPILLHADILRNILYSGVWSKYEYLQIKNAGLRKSKEKEHKQ